MKKTVIIFGIIAGLISSLLMAVTLPFHDRIGFDYALITGYATMVIAFLSIFFGIRSYRENVGGGYITFLRGLAIGLLITVISGVFYVGMWEIIYHKFAPDYIDKYAQHMLDKAKASGKSQAEIDAQAKEMDDMKKLVANPLLMILFVYMEPLPVGILISLISALILRKKRPLLDSPAPPLPGKFA